MRPGALAVLLVAVAGIIGATAWAALRPGHAPPACPAAGTPCASGCAARPDACPPPVPQVDLAGCTVYDAILFLAKGTPLPAGFEPARGPGGTYTYVLDILSCPALRLADGRALGAATFAYVGPAVSANPLGNITTADVYAVEAYTDNPALADLARPAGAHFQAATLQATATPGAVAWSIAVNGTERYAGVWQTTRQAGAVYLGPFRDFLPSDSGVTYGELNLTFQHLESSGVLRASSGLLLDASQGMPAMSGFFDSRKVLAGSLAFVRLPA